MGGGASRSGSAPCPDATSSRSGSAPDATPDATSVEADIAKLSLSPSVKECGVGVCGGVSRSEGAMLSAR